MFVSDSYTKHPLLFMNRESLLKTVALNKYVKCFLNKNASKHLHRQKNTFISNCLIIVREAHCHSQKVILQLVHRFHKGFVREFYITGFRGVIKLSAQVSTNNLQVIKISSICLWHK